MTAGEARLYIKAILASDQPRGEQHEELFRLKCLLVRAGNVEAWEVVKEAYAESLAAQGTRMDPRMTARCYVRSIRSRTKSEYANSYLLWRLGMVNQEPPRGELSAMAAQAVRLEIDEILRDGSAKTAGSIGG